MPRWNTCCGRPCERFSVTRLSRFLVALTTLALSRLALASPLEPSRQLVVVLSEDWDAQTGTLYRWERKRFADRWSLIGPPLAVWIGRRGLAWRSDSGASAPPPMPGPMKREGDGRSPAGLLSLDELWGYDGQAPAGVSLPYHQATAQDRCVDDVDSPLYNQLIKQTSPPTWRSAEQLRMPTDHYKYLVVLGYNRGPVRPGAGSCIFLHVAPSPQTPTAGCTALREPELLTLLRWLSPTKHPLLLQLPRQALPATVSAWHLPPELLQRPAKSPQPMSPEARQR